MQRFKTAAELVEAKAQAMHLANLTSGGVFVENADGTEERYSNLDAERRWAPTKLHYVFETLAKFDRIPEAVTCYYIEHIGYTTDLQGGALLMAEGNATLERCEHAY